MERGRRVDDRHLHAKKGGGGGGGGHRQYVDARGGGGGFVAHTSPRGTTEVTVHPAAPAPPQPPSGRGVPAGAVIGAGPGPGRPRSTRPSAAGGAGSKPGRESYLMTIRKKRRDQAERQRALAAATTTGGDGSAKQQPVRGLVKSFSDLVLGNGGRGAGGNQEEGRQASQRHRQSAPSQMHRQEAPPQRHQKESPPQRHRQEAPPQKHQEARPRHEQEVVLAVPPPADVGVKDGAHDDDDDEHVDDDGFLGWGSRDDSDPEAEDATNVVSFRNPSPVASAAGSSVTGGGGGDKARRKSKRANKAPKLLDRFGFIVREDGLSSSLISCGSNGKELSQPIALDPAEAQLIIEKKSVKREKKWASMMDDMDATRTQRCRARQLVRRARKGVPHNLRGAAWAQMGGVPDKIEFRYRGAYLELVRQSTGKGEEGAEGGGTGGGAGGIDGALSPRATIDTIERDINRTFPRHHMFYDASLSDDENSGSGGGENGDLDGMGSDSDSESSVEPDGDGTLTPVWSGVPFASRDQTHGNGNGNGKGDEDEEDDLDDYDGGLDDSGWGRRRAEDDYGRGVESISMTRPLMGVAGGGSDTVAHTSSFGATDGQHRRHANFGGTVADSGGKNRRGLVRDGASSRLLTDQEKKQLEGVVSGFAAATGGQASLRRVLRAYSVFDSEVGYCQGMNFIAAMFLTFMSEEEAFWLLVFAMTEEPCRMRGLFGERMADTHRVLYVAEGLIKQFLPKLWKHFEQENVHITMYATQWLLTLYASCFPFDLVTRVWDCFLAEGWKVVYRVMLAILDRSSPVLMDLRFEEILGYFRDLPNNIDGDEMLEAALKIPLKRRHIEKYENEWAKQQQR